MTNTRVTHDDNYVDQDDSDDKVIQFSSMI